MSGAHIRRFGATPGSFKVHNVRERARVGTFPAAWRALTQEQRVGVRAALNAEDVRLCRFAMHERDKGLADTARDIARACRLVFRMLRDAEDGP